MKKFMGEFLNEKPFEHRCSNGIVFECGRCDLSGPIKVTIPDYLDSPERIRRAVMEDMAEMIGFHACNIHPYLNGFSGYDTLKFGLSGEESGERMGKTPSRGEICAALSEKARMRTSPENVADVMEAIASIMKAKPEPEEEKTDDQDGPGR